MNFFMHIISAVLSILSNGRIECPAGTLNLCWKIRVVSGFCDGTMRAWEGHEHLWVSTHYPKPEIRAREPPSTQHQCLGNRKASHWFVSKKISCVWRRCCSVNICEVSHSHRQVANREIKALNMEWPSWSQYLSQEGNRYEIFAKYFCQHFFYIYGTIFKLCSSRNIFKQQGNELAWIWTSYYKRM